MTVTRAIGATAMLAGLAIGTAGTAWADTTMSGHYVMNETNTGGQTTALDLYFTPCGDGCANVSRRTGGGAAFQARLVNGQWTMDGPGDVNCPDGTVVRNASNDHYTWDPNTLAGTDVITVNVPSCGDPAGNKGTNSIQFRQAP
jgi:hypothetical protein